MIAERACDRAFLLEVLARPEEAVEAYERALLEADEAQQELMFLCKVRLTQLGISAGEDSSAILRSTAKQEIPKGLIYQLTRLWADQLAEEGRHEEVLERLYELRSGLGRDHQLDPVEPALRIAEAHLAAGDVPSAERLARRALVRLEAQDPAHWLIGEVFQLLARCANSPNEKRVRLDRSIAAQQRHLVAIAQAGRRTDRAKRALALTYVKAGRWREAAVALQAVLDLEEGRFGKDHPAAVATRLHLAKALGRFLDRGEAARELFEQSWAVLKGQPKRYSPRLSKAVLQSYVAFLLRLGRRDEAETLLSEAEDLGLSSSEDEGR